MGALTDKYCIVGVGESTYSRASGRTVLSMACEAIIKAAADAGLDVKDIDGITSYQGFDSTAGTSIAGSLGIKLNYSVDIIGGGSSGEALIANAIGLLEGGYARCIAIFRSMNGRSGRRPGGRSPTGPQPMAMAQGGMAYNMMCGLAGAPLMFSHQAMWYLQKYGYNTDPMGYVAVAHRNHASLNPKATRKDPITLEDHHNSRWIAKPYRLLDCCQENDVACAEIIVDASWAQELRHPPVYIRGGLARVHSDRPDHNYTRINPVDSVFRRTKERLFGMSETYPEDVEIFSLYDNFTTSPLFYWEALGYVPQGEAGRWIDQGRTIGIDGPYAENLSGGHHSEGYTHGIQMVVENVRQLRGRVDDYCPRWYEGVHTYDRSKGCRQAVARDDRGKEVASPRLPKVALSVGSGGLSWGSAVILRS